MHEPTKTLPAEGPSESGQVVLTRAATGSPERIGPSAFPGGVEGREGARSSHLWPRSRDEGCPRKGLFAPTLGTRTCRKREHALTRRSLAPVWGSRTCNPDSLAAVVSDRDPVAAEKSLHDEVVLRSPGTWLLSIPRVVEGGTCLNCCVPGTSAPRASRSRYRCTAPMMHRSTRTVSQGEISPSKSAIGIAGSRRAGRHEPQFQGRAAC